MFEVINVSRFPRTAKNPVAWSLTFLLAGLTWVPTLQQTLGMGNMPMYGTMGMTLTPFLLFWTMMMAAMMLPSPAPVISVRMTAVRRQVAHSPLSFVYLLIFLLGYLCLWCLVGIPIFVCCLGVDYLVRVAPQLVLVPGIMIFACAGLYQLTPQKKRALLHCSPGLDKQKSCNAAHRPIPFNLNFERDYSMVSLVCNVVGA